MKGEPEDICNEDDSWYDVETPSSLKREKTPETEETVDGPDDESADEMEGSLLIGEKFEGSIAIVDKSERRFLEDMLMSPTSAEIARDKTALDIEKMIENAVTTRMNRLTGRLIAAIKGEDDSGANGFILCYKLKTSKNWRTASYVAKSRKALSDAYPKIIGSRRYQYKVVPVELS